MSRIETEIWEPHPEKRGMVRYVGQRKTADVFRDVETFLKEENLYPEDYLKLSFGFESRYEEFPKMLDIRCYAQWGGNEGIYLQADLLIQNKYYAAKAILDGSIDDLLIVICGWSVSSLLDSVNSNM